MKKNGFYWPDGADKHIKRSLAIKSLVTVLDRWSKDRRKVAVQAGGSYGVWPKTLATEFDFVYTFEPERESFKYLNMNCTEENIYPFRAVLNKSNDCVTVKKNSFTSHKVVSNEGFTPSICVDQLNLPACDALLLDIEGYEYNAFLGATRTIKKYHPLILFEDRLELLGSTREDIYLLLDALNYVQVADIKSDKIYVHKGDIDLWN